MENISTHRLTIIPCGIELCDSILFWGNEKLKLMAGAEPSNGWPLKEALDFFSVYRSYLLSDQSLMGWGAWIIVANAGNLIVGDIGFLGKPSWEGDVEIGYSIAPGSRGNGYAFEAAEALISWAFNDSRVMKITAKCEPDNLASSKILKKLGMNFLYTRENLMIWEISKKNRKI